MSDSQLSTGAKVECLAYAVIAAVALVGTQWALVEGIQGVYRAGQTLEAAGMILSGQSPDGRLVAYAAGLTATNLRVFVRPRW